MKKLLLILLFSKCLFSLAQDRKIAFQETSLVNALDVARASKKVVFVDCYTSWCVPCKYMENSVFSVDSVADFFNAKLVNLKIDMEKGEGPEMQKRYSIGAYPTYLLLDGQGKLLYKFIGSMKPDEFMAKIRSGLKPDNEVALMNERFDSGERNSDFLRDYALLKIRLKEIPKANVADSLFLKYTDLRDVAKRKNWVLFGENRYAMYLSETNSRNFELLVANWKLFAKENTKDTVDHKMASVFRKIASDALRGYSFKIRPFKQEDFNRYKKQILTTALPERDQYIDLMDMAIAAGKKDITGLTRIMASKVPHFTQENMQITWDYINYCQTRKLYSEARKAKVSDLISAATDNPFLKRTCQDFKRAYNASVGE